MAVDDLTDVYAEIKKLKRMVERLSMQNWLLNAAIGAGGIRVYDGGKIWFEGGGGIDVRDDGFFNLDGTFTGNGEMTWTGKWKFTGEGQITGPLTISGDVMITGNVTLQGNGKIVVGKMRIDPTVGQGAVVFENGGQVFSDATTVQVYKGNGVAQISNTEARLQLGGKSVSLTADGFRFLGVPKVTKAGVPSGCYYKGTDGYVYEG